MPDIWMNVDAALSEVPVNLLPLIDDSDFKTREESVTYNQAGLDLVWNFVTAAGAFTQTAVTPTDTAGAHDWVNQGNGMYTIEIPASGGTIDNDTEGFGWFTGYATGILPWRGPVIGFRVTGLNDMTVGWFNRVADHVIRRTFQNACDSSDGDTKSGRSLLGAIAKLVNKVTSSGGTLTVYEDDDTTGLFTQAITTSGSAEPITELDTA